MLQEPPVSSIPRATIDRFSTVFLLSGKENLGIFDGVSRLQLETVQIFRYLRNMVRVLGFGSMNIYFWKMIIDEDNDDVYDE